MKSNKKTKQNKPNNNNKNKKKACKQTLMYAAKKESIKYYKH